MDKEVLDFQKTVINGLKERYLDWNIKAQDNDTCNIILQVTTDDGWYGTINLSNLYEQHHDEELTIDDAIDAAANEFFFNARIVCPVVHEGSCVDYFSLEEIASNEIESRRMEMENIRCVLKYSDWSDNDLDVNASKSILDMSILFYHDNTEIEYLLHPEVTYKDLKAASIDVNELYDYVIKKMKDKFPATITSKRISDNFKDTYRIMSKGYECTSALAFLYPDVLKQFAESKNCNLYIILKNVDEAYIATESEVQNKADGKSEKEIRMMLDEMMQQFNRGNFDFCVLSEFVYYYDREENSLAAVSHEGEINKTEKYFL